MSESMSAEQRAALGEASNALAQETAAVLDVNWDAPWGEQVHRCLLAAKSLAERTPALLAEIDRLAEQVKRVRELHPKRENPRHGCCAEPKVCEGHAPECRGRSHGLNPPTWPCADIRALDAES